MIGRHALPYGPVHMSIKILEKVKSNSVHFPEIIRRGKIERVKLQHSYQKGIDRFIKFKFVTIEYQAIRVIQVIEHHVTSHFKTSLSFKYVGWHHVLRKLCILV